MTRHIEPCNFAFKETQANVKAAVGSRSNTTKYFKTRGSRIKKVSRYRVKFSPRTKTHDGMRPVNRILVELVTRYLSQKINTVANIHELTVGEHHLLNYVNKKLMYILNRCESNGTAPLIFNSRIVKITQEHVPHLYKLCELISDAWSNVHCMSKLYK